MTHKKLKKKVTFDKSININEQEFLITLSSSLSLCLQEKRQILDSLSSLSHLQIVAISEVFDNEKKQFSTCSEINSNEINQLINKTKVISTT